MVSTLGRTYQIAVSVVVLIILGAQTTTLFLTVMQRGTGATYWPILTYGMYATSNHEGQNIDVHYLLSGVTRDGEVVDITRQDLRLRFFDFQILTRKLAHSDPREGVVILEKRYPRELAEVSVKTYPLELARDGAVPAPSTVVKHIVLPASVGVESSR